MTSKITRAKPFDPFHPDGLIFEDSPDLFVDLGASPIVFTVRGLALFSERFKQVGIKIAGISTREDFETAHRLWLEVERTLLESKLSRQAMSASPLSEAALLEAIWTGDLERAEDIASRRDRIEVSGLRVV